MDFIGIPTDYRTDPRWINATASQRGTWLTLYLYCAAAENGGRIADCLEWSDTLWQRAAAVSKDEAADGCALYWFEGCDLVVGGYDATREKRRQTLTMRERASLGGRSKSPKKQEAARQNGANHTGNPSTTQADPSSNPSTAWHNPTEEKRREEKRREEKGREEKRSEAEHGGGGIGARVREDYGPESEPQSLESEMWLDAPEAVRYLNPVFGQSPDIVCSSATMEASRDIWPGGVPVSQLRTVEAFYASAPDFRSTRARDTLHADDPRRFRKFKLASLIADWAEQEQLARRWISGEWKHAGIAADSPEGQKKEKAAPVSLPPPEGWEMAWPCMFDEPLPETWDDIPPAWKTDLRRYCAEMNQPPTP